MKERKFVSDGMSQIAQVYFNDKWYRRSMYQIHEYLEKAKWELEQVYKPDVKVNLQNILKKVIHDTMYIISFCDEIEKFKKASKWRDLFVKLTRQIVLFQSYSQLVFIHRRLVRNLMDFHSQLSEILNWENGEFIR